MPFPGVTARARRAASTALARCARWNDDIISIRHLRRHRGGRNGRTCLGRADGVVANLQRNLRCIATLSTMAASTSSSAVTTIGAVGTRPRSRAALATLASLATVPARLAVGPDPERSIGCVQTLHAHSEAYAVDPVCTCTSRQALRSLALNIVDRRGGPAVSKRWGPGDPSDDKDP